MTVVGWWKKLTSRLTRSSAGRGERSRKRALLQVEALEERTLLDAKIPTLAGYLDLGLAKAQTELNSAMDRAVNIPLVGDQVRKVNESGKTRELIGQLSNKVKEVFSKELQGASDAVEKAVRDQLYDLLNPDDGQVKLLGDLDGKAGVT